MWQNCLLMGREYKWTQPHYPKRSNPCQSWLPHSEQMSQEMDSQSSVTSNASSLQTQDSGLSAPLSSISRKSWWRHTPNSKGVHANKKRNIVDKTPPNTDTPSTSLITMTFSNFSTTTPITSLAGSFGNPLAPVLPSNPAVSSSGSQLDNIPRHALSDSGVAPSSSKTLWYKQEVKKVWTIFYPRCPNKYHKLIFSSPYTITGGSAIFGLEFLPFW